MEKIDMTTLSSWKDKALFTPGPLTTSITVKQAMLRDLGSRDQEFINIVREIRQELAALSGAAEEYTAVLMQGSGTFGIESVLSSVIPPNGKLLILINGAYGERMLKIAKIHGITTVVQRCSENKVPDVNALERLLEEDHTFTHLAVVHCETTTGIINPIAEYGRIARDHKLIYIVDAMSSFGAYPVNLKEAGIDFLVSSSNKCIEGVPGFSFVLCNQESLLATRGFARTLSLDLLAQWEGLEGDGQFRFTPPIHALLAFRQALRELDAEGGVNGRAQRYTQNHEFTLQGMQALGFEPYLEKEYRGYIITSFYYPKHEKFDFKVFYQKLSERGQIIYPGKLSQEDCFRIGHIGRLNLSDVQALLAAVSAVLNEMGVEINQKVIQP
jgi:2-aminoethylphosphonate-pyruvate transaminase